MKDSPPREPGSVDLATITRNARYGLFLFAIYLALFGGFVGMNAFAPSKMEWIVFAGLNLAIVSGFGLIAAAFLLSFLYGWIVRNPAETRKVRHEDSRR